MIVFRRIFCHIMEQIWPKKGVPCQFFWFLSILLISCIPNVSKKTFHDTGQNKLSAEKIEGLISITLCQLVEQLRPK